MFKKLLTFLQGKNTGYLDEEIMAANAEFDALMVAVENDQTALINLERHLRDEFDEIAEQVKEDCAEAERVLD